VARARAERVVQELVQVEEGVIEASNRHDSETKELVRGEEVFC